MTEKPKARPYADIKNPFTVDQGGAFAEYYLRDPDLMPDLGLGSRILVYDKRDNKDVWITATVVGLKAVSPFDPERQNLLYIEDESQDPTRLLTTLNGPHSHQPLLIKARLEREMTIVEEDGTKKIYSSAIQRPPSSSSNMRFPDILPINGSNEPCLQEMLDIKEKGISLGAIGFGNHPYEQDNKFLFYKWDLDNLDNKHIFIVGESGSGKTVLLKNLALQIREHDPDMRIIMTDIQGDLAQLIVPSVISERKVEGWQSKIKRDKIEDSLKKIGPFQIIIPVSKESGSSPNIIALKKLAVKNSVQVREIGLRLQDLSYPSEVEYLYRVQSEQVASLLDEEAEEIRRQSNPVTVARLRESITNLLTQTRGGQINSHGGTPYYPTTGYAAQRALRNLSNYFDHHQQSMGLSNNPLDLLDFQGTTILFLEHLNHEERLMWEMQLVQWLYNHKRDNWKAFVFFDEAHQIVPAKSSLVGSKVTFQLLRTNFERLAREGRKFDIHLVLSTQSPRDLHQIVPEQCPTRIVMKIDPKNAEAAFLDKDLALIANRFGHGQFWLKSPFNGTPEWVRVHSWMPSLPHSSMTSFWEELKKQAKDK